MGGGLRRPTPITKSERIPKSQLNTAVSRFVSAFVQERRGVVGSVRNPPIACVGGIEEVRVNLEGMPFENPRILNKAEIQPVNAVRAQNAAARVAYGVRSCNAAEQARSTGRLNFPHSHSGEVQRCVEE